MNITNWSNLIYKYYFERRPVDSFVLHISMQDLIDFAKEENVEILNGQYASSFEDSFIRNDFVRKFWIDKNGNRDLRDLQDKMNQIRNQAINENNDVLLLSIVAILIMPICENDELELHGNDYYGHLLPFLYTNRFIDEQSSSPTLLPSIKLDEIWDRINKWASENSLSFKSRGVLSENGSKQYVRSLMRESLLSPSKLQKFCFLFDHAGLVPKVNIEDDRLLSSFTNFYSYIGISSAKFKQLTSKVFREYLIAVLRNEYDNWDGTTRIKERDNRTGRIHVESGNSCYPLLLQMDYDLHSNICSFAFQLYCSDIDEMDYLTFVSDSSKVQYPDVYIKNDGYANRPFHLDDSEIKSVFASRQGIYGIHEKFDKSLKGRHVVTDYYILRQYKNKYIATNEFIKGEFYFAIIRHEAADDFASWLQANNAILITNNALGELYSVYRIEHAIEELPNKNNLRFKSEIRCKSVNNLEVKTSDNNDVVYLSNLLPAQFEITGVDVSKDRIYAVSVNDKHRNSSELKYDHDRGLWILKVFSNVFQIKKEFQLFCNEAQIPFARIYKFVDFVMPSKFKEVSLDQWGGTSETTLSEGLELSKSVVEKSLINWTTLNLQMQNAQQSHINKGKYLEKDFLLYAITSASYDTNRWLITMPWLKEIRDRLSSEYDKDEYRPSTDKYSLVNALADYFRMGYINYAYTEKGFHLTANRPTLILLTPKFERLVSPSIANRKIITFKCSENTYKCLLTGGRTIALVRKIEKLQQSLGFQVEILESSDYLQPQTIYIHAAKRSVFKQLAKECNLLYQDNIYANALIEALPSVENYITEQRANGIERDLFGVKSFRAIDYQHIASIYPAKLAAKQAIANHEIDRKSFDESNDVASFFPGSRDETTVMIIDGRMVEIDKYWGHFVGMYMTKAKILQYNGDAIQISMPQQFRLPLMYARALTLLNGNTPNSVFGSRTYSLGVNPCTFASKPENILQKLGQ